MKEQATEALLATLRQTETEVAELTRLLESQLAAVRDRNSDELNVATHGLTEIARRLEALFARKQRESRAIAGLVDPDAQRDIPPQPAELEAEIARVESRIRRHAEQTHRLYEDLAFALHFAARMDAELIRSVWDARRPEEATIYTSTGATGQTGRASGMINQVG